MPVRDIVRFVAITIAIAGCSGEHPAVVGARSEPPPTAPTSATSAARPDKIFKPKADAIKDDASLPPRAVHVSVLDADEEPIRHALVTLETIQPRPDDVPEVISKDTAFADEKGVAIFRHVIGEGEQLHIVSTRRGDGTYPSEPFAIKTGGKRVSLHAYETTRDIDNALVAAMTIHALFVHADSIEIEVIYNVFNLGRVAWVPTETRVGFPPNVTGFKAYDVNLPLQADDIGAAGFSLVGTVAPGQHEFHYKYQVPRDPSGTQRLVLDEPPHVAKARVLLEAGDGAHLAVKGFDDAKPLMADGRAYLVSQREMSRGEGGLRQLEITFSGKPR